MTHSQYRHFLSRAEEGMEAMILPAGGHDCMGCFTDQVKLTPALVRDLDEAIREVKLLGEHECHTPFRERGNEASIRVPRMFKSHA
jgi:hypothetical protein